MIEPRRNRGGKPQARFVVAALALIRESGHPISTLALIERFGLSYSEEMSLRRALRREALLGRVLCVGKVLDGSFAWVGVDEAAEGRDRAVLGAAHAAAAYLRDRLGGEVALDVDAFKTFLASTMTHPSA